MTGHRHGGRRRTGWLILAAAFGLSSLGLAYTRFHNQGCESDGYPVIYLEWPPILDGGGAVNGGVFVNPNCGDPGCPDTTERDAVVRAMTTWTDAPFHFSFVFSGDTTAVPYDGTYSIDLTDGLSVCGWQPIDGPGGMLARSWIFFECWGEILEADIEFDDAQDWVAEGTIPTGDFDVESVALHELGHVLGLDHSVPPAVMQPYFYAGYTRRELTQDDIDGGIAIYGPEPSSVEDFADFE